MIVGYQARGSLGRRLVDKQKSVRIHGDTVKVNATVHTIGGLSAHGDENDLAKWYSGFSNKPPVYLVHGESRSAAALAEKFAGDFGATVRVPNPGDTIDLAKV